MTVKNGDNARQRCPLNARATPRSVTAAKFNLVPFQRHFSARFFMFLVPDRHVFLYFCLILTSMFLYSLTVL